MQKLEKVKYYTLLAILDWDLAINEGTVWYAFSRINDGANKYVFSVQALCIPSNTHKMTPKTK